MSRKLYSVSQRPLAALEQADVILMHDKIENVEEAFRLSRRARAL